jgi:hypothetical protein
MPRGVHLLTDLWTALISRALVVSSIGLAGCASLGGGIVSDDVGVIDVTEVSVHAGSSAVTSSGAVRVPTGSGGAGPALAGAITAGVLSSIERAANEQEVRFLDRMKVHLSGDELQERIRKFVRSYESGNGGRYSAQALPNTQRRSSLGGSLPAVSVSVRFVHGLGLADFPLLTPKVTAHVEYRIVGVERPVKQKLTVVGVPPKSLSIDWTDLQSWWSADDRYRRFVDRSVDAVAVHIIWTLRVDPARTDAAMRSEVLRLASAVSSPAASSDECSVAPSGGKVNLFFQRRPSEVLVAALCAGSPALAADSMAAPLVWLFEAEQ